MKEMIEDYENVKEYIEDLDLYKGGDGAIKDLYKALKKGEKLNNTEALELIDSLVNCMRSEYGD